VAERINLLAYMLFTVIMSGFIYPVVVHWVWSSKGWLSAFNQSGFRNGDFYQGTIGDNGFLDFAGSGVVHLTGGAAAFVGAAILGPRYGRFGPKGEASQDKYSRNQLFRPHNKTLVALGTLILWYGWYGFNCGSTLALSGGVSILAGRVAVNTTLGAAGGAFGALFLARIVEGHWEIDALLNGILAGLVSITAGCAVVEPYAALVIGFLGGIFYVLFVMFLNAIRVDDPLNASAVHGACGIWGCIAVGLFCTARNLTQAYGFENPSSFGAFYGGGWQQLGIQFLGWFTILCWSAAMSALVFLPMKLLGILRVPHSVEEYGLDATEHGGGAYDSPAYMYEEPKEEFVEVVGAEEMYPATIFSQPTPMTTPGAMPQMYYPGGVQPATVPYYY